MNCGTTHPKALQISWWIGNDGSHSSPLITQLIFINLSSTTLREELEQSSAKKLLAGCDGILVPGGFGDRGFEGKISAIQYARENDVPFFGICLGLQMAIIEYARKC